MLAIGTHGSMVNPSHVPAPLRSRGHGLELSSESTCSFELCMQETCTFKVLVHIQLGEYTR